MLRRVRSAGMSKRAFFFRIPSRLRFSGECDRGAGLCCLILLVNGRDSWSLEPVEVIVDDGHEFSDTVAEDCSDDCTEAGYIEAGVMLEGSNAEGAGVA